MVSSYLLLVLFSLLEFSSFAQTPNRTDDPNHHCEYIYGNWTACIQNTQSRSYACTCGGVVSSDQTLCNSSLLIASQYCECKWRWSKWSICTARCGGGNTTRIPQCYCNHDQLTSNDSQCEGTLYFGLETVPCNQYECGQVFALNKLYWISGSNIENWPIENEVFNCSLGEDPDDTPKGLTFYDILSDPTTTAHKHPEWYLLAKEWITAKLNLANGVDFSSESIQIIQTVGALLDNCAGYSDDQIPQIFTLKEKLGRLNNNIGGLENVDIQTTILIGEKTRNDDSREESRVALILAIAIPLWAVVIVALAVSFTIYYVRQKTATLAIDRFESEDDEEGEPLQNEPSGETLASSSTSSAKPVAADSQITLETIPMIKDDDSTEEEH